MRAPTDGTGVPPGNGRLRGSMSRSRPHSVQYSPKRRRAVRPALLISVVDQNIIVGKQSSPLIQSEQKCCAKRTNQSYDR